MNLELPAEVSDFVKELVLRGKFDSEQAAVVEAVRLMMSRERLRSEIQKGIEQVDKGDCLDEQTIFGNLDSEIDQIEASRQEP